MADVYGFLRKKLGELSGLHGYDDEPVAVRARALTPAEAIGSPEDDDYPLLKGKERMMAASFRGAEGHAFTDMFGNCEGSLGDILGMELTNNFRRAVFISTLNAVSRSLGVAEKTMHCRDAGPRECASQLTGYVESCGNPRRIALFGLQPRMLEALAAAFEVRVNDMDEDNVGVVRAGVRIEGPPAEGRNLDWCDLALVTGTTVVNGTLKNFIDRGKPVVFYGVSISGTAALLGLNRYCPRGM